MGSITYDRPGNTFSVLRICVQIADQVNTRSNPGSPTSETLTFNLEADPSLLIAATGCPFVRRTGCRNDTNMAHDNAGWQAVAFVAAGSYATGI